MSIYMKNCSISRQWSESDMDKISVIIPVYKTEKYLEKCVKSVIAQTYENLEIILVDDGSPDNSGTLCDKLAESDDRIKVIHKTNGGLSSARNAGIDAAVGDYLGFVDSDDWIDPKMYEVLHNMLAGNGLDISCCNIMRMRGNEEIPIIKDLSLDVTYTGREAALRVLDEEEKILFSMANKLFRAELFNNIRLREGILFEDFQIMPRLLLKSEKVTCTGKPLYYYFESEGSILRGEYSLRMFDYVNICRESILFYKEKCPEGYDRIREIYVSKCLDIIFRSYNERLWDSCRRYIIEDLKKIANTDIYDKLRKNVKLKLRILFISPDLYYVASELNRRVKTLLRREEILYDTANGF